MTDTIDAAGIVAALVKALEWQLYAADDGPTYRAHCPVLNCLHCAEDEDTCDRIDATRRARIAAALDVGKIVALVADVEYIASATDMEGYEPGMWAINRARNALAAFKEASHG